MTAATLPDGTLAGYRLVRKIGFGSRSDLYLGVGRTGTVALKVFRAETPSDSIGAELDALGRVDSPHLVRLLDVAGGPEGLPVLIFERVARGSLAALLADRETIECGEAVTLLAPIAALVAELHDAGVAHGRIGWPSVHLGAEGQPILLGFGHCELFASGGTMAAIDAEPVAATDRDALAAFALALLERVRSTAGDNRTRDLESWIDGAPRAYEFPRELAERLFACADAMPVTMPVTTSGEPTTARAIPARVVALGQPAREATVTKPVLSEQPPTWLPSWVANVMVENPIELVKKRIGQVANGVRPRFWVAAAGAAVALVVAVALIPSGKAPAASSTRPVRVATHSTAVPSATAVPDDPLLAAKALLVLRQTCFRDRSILCLDDVDEASSGAFTSDAALIQQIQSGGEIPKSAIAAAATPTLTERLGDTALIGLSGESHPASILVIRTKAGWRIRDILSGAQASSAPASG